MVYLQSGEYFSESNIKQDADPKEQGCLKIEGSGKECRVQIHMIIQALIVPACQPGWEEMENARGNLRTF